MSDYSHPNDTKRIELLKEVQRWSNIFLAEIDDSIIDTDMTMASELQKAITASEDFELQLKQIEEGKQLDLFSELEN